jgi:hypothetical protein
VAASTGIITTIAGNGGAGYNGDGLATGAALSYPSGVAVDGVGNVYIGDTYNYRIRKVAPATGIISTVAGTGVAGFTGEAGQATAARLNVPLGLGVDAAGNVYIADYGNDRIRKLHVANGLLTTVAGSGIRAFGGDGGEATAGQINLPQGVALDSAGNLYIADTSNHRVRRVSVPTRDGGSDYDNDGKADLALYRPSTGYWYIKQSSTNYASYLAYQWGLSTDIAVPGDYDGDGRGDLGLYRPSTGYWYVLLSNATYTTYLALPWGISGDIPVPGDYDGDGKADLGLYRPSTGYWYILLSSTNYTTYIAKQWGLSTDVAVGGDYDGDGKTDLGLYRPSTGYWYVLLSSANYTTYLASQWGLSTDISVAGDYDGDGKTDLGVYRPSTGYWYILKSSSNFTSYLALQWGLSTDIVLGGGDYDGDGKADLALYRPSTGYWYILQSSTNYATYIAQQWGISTDIPVLQRR